jgi:glycine/D-amino acid oxidase-like deaminating enzyme
VLVIGGGVAGVSAAVAAARNGVDTVLVEKEAYLGGTGYAGMFQYMCGLYMNADTVPTEPLNAGITREVVARLKQAAPEKTIKKIGQVYVLSYSHDTLQSVLRALCLAEEKLTVLHETDATAVNTDQGMINAVTVERSNIQQTISATMVIDCTGSGYISAAAGAEFEISPLGTRQLAGFTLYLKGLKDVGDALALQVPYHCMRAAQQGILSSSLRFTTFSPGDAADEGYCKMNIDGAEGHARDEKARKEAEILVRYLARVLPAFIDAEIVRTSHKVLDREGRRISGHYTLTEEDVLAGRKFSDGVVKNSWPIELWDGAKGSIYKYVLRGDYYEIPFRCIRVKGIENLMTAGRCISVTHTALGSTRVMGTCMALGDHAGRAAVYYARNGKYPEFTKEC